MKKIDREFLLTDDSVNCYGYRLLTSGLQLDRFDPPIGFFMHEREQGVAVRWEDLVVRDNALYGKPVVDDSRFPDLVKQIEDGFYSAASVGHIVALEMSEEPSLKMEGQTGPTVTKWFPRECSIVDIPGNYNAVAQSKLFDEDNNVLMDLSDKQTNSFMKKRTITIEALLAIGLPNLVAESTSEQAVQIIKDLVDKATRTDQAEADLHSLQAEMTSLKEQVTTEKVSAIVEKALADHKVNAAMADKLKKDYATNPAGLEALVAAIPAQATISAQLKAEELPEKYKGKTWHDLYMQEGALEDIKKNYPSYYEKLVANR